MGRTNFIIFLVILLSGFILRIFLVDKVIVGDLLAYAEWGEKFFTGNTIWTYSVPNYPPLAILIFTAIDWLWQHKFVLAQMHNLIKIPPHFSLSIFTSTAIFFLKLLPILSDLALGAIIFKAVLAISGKVKQALLASAFYLLNPITVFISGAWGQTDSLVALFGILAVVFSKTAWLSIPVFILGILIKPSWAVMVPFFAYVVIAQKVPFKKILIGLAVSSVFFILIMIPFSAGNSLGELLIPLTSGNKASVSAFNFFTIFYTVDRDLSNLWLKGFGVFAYILLNIIAITDYKKFKNPLLGIFTGLFIIGMGSFIFMPGMLERYFFPGLVPLTVLMFCLPGILSKGILINLLLFANIVWSFHRRGYFEIGNPFTNNNSLLIRILSVALVTLFVSVLLMLQSKRGRRNWARDR